MMDKKINVRMAICASRSIEARTAWCWANAAAYTATKLRSVFPGGCGLSNQLHETSILPMGREEMLLSAAEDGATHLVCFDSDMIFAPHVPLNLIASLELSKAGMVGCAYAARRGRPVSTAKDLNGNRVFLGKKRQPNYVEAKWMGFGAVCIDVEKAIVLPAPRFEFTHIGGRAWEGEDIRFCRLMREAGHKLYIDVRTSKDVAHIATRELGVGEMCRGE